MRKIANLAWLNFLQLFKDRSQLLTFILMPLMLTFLFGTMMGGGERKVAVAIADLDGTEYSKEIVGALPAGSYDLRRVSEEVARQMTSSGEVAAALLIPRGLGADVIAGIDTKVKVLKDPRSTSALAVVEAVRGRTQRVAANARIVRIVRDAFRDAERLTGAPAGAPEAAAVYSYADRLWSPEPPLSVDDVPVTASKTRGSATQATGFQQYSLGFTLMFMLFMGVGSAGGFLDEREQGTLARLLTTPTSRALLVVGKVVSIYVLVLFQAVVMVGFGAFVFGVPWGNDPLGVAMIIGVYALAATGLGVMVSTLVRTRGQMSAVTAISATALAMLGGCYWPVDILNPTMRTIAFLTPTGWAMSGLTNVVVRYQGTAAAVTPTLALVGMATAFLAVGMFRLKLE